MAEIAVDSSGIFIVSNKLFSTYNIISLLCISYILCTLYANNLNGFKEKTLHKYLIHLKFQTRKFRSVANWRMRYAFDVAVKYHWCNISLKWITDFLARDSQKIVFLENLSAWTSSFIWGELRCVEYAK